MLYIDRSSRPVARILRLPGQGPFQYPFQCPPLPFPSTPLTPTSRPTFPSPHLSFDAVVQRLERPAYTAQTSSLALGHEDTCIPSSRAYTWPDLPHRASAAQHEGAVSNHGRASVCRLRLALQRLWLSEACRWQSWVIRPTGCCSSPAWTLQKHGRASLQTQCRVNDVLVEVDVTSGRTSHWQRTRGGQDSDRQRWWPRAAGPGRVLWHCLCPVVELDPGSGIGTAWVATQSKVARFCLLLNITLIFIMDQWTTLQSVVFPIIGVIVLCRLLVKSIVQESGVFEGPPENLVFTHSTKLLATDTYRIMGQLLGISLTQGGPGVCSLALPVYQYWTERPVSDDKLTAELIADYEMRNNVQQVHMEACAIFIK